VYNTRVAQIEEIPKTYEEAIRSLAESHGEAGPDDLVIFAAENPDDNVVRLISVSEDFPDLGEIGVYRFGASEQFPFQTADVLLRPEQWAKIRSGTGHLRLPAEWHIASARQVWPPPVEARIHD
jgi:hypothetical protein